MTLLPKILAFIIWLVSASWAMAQSVDPAADKILGRVEAPVTIIEYASLTCSHCADFHNTILPQIKRDWIDTGRAKLVYRDFPLDNFALGAAMIAHCAAPDRYFPLLAAMFETQKTWLNAANPADELKKIAKLGGISEAAFGTCLKNEPLLQKIRAGQQTAQEKWGIDSTPTFIINGKKVAGTASYAQFNKLLEEASQK